MLFTGEKKLRLISENYMKHINTLCVKFVGFFEYGNYGALGRGGGGVNSRRFNSGVQDNTNRSYSILWHSITHDQDHVSATSSQLWTLIQIYHHKYGNLIHISVCECTNRRAHKRIEKWWKFEGTEQTGVSLTLANRTPHTWYNTADYSNHHSTV